MNRHISAKRQRQPEKYAGIFATLVAYLTIEFIRPQVFLPWLGVLRPAMILGIILTLFSLSQLKDQVYRDRSVRLMIAFVFLVGMSVLTAVNKRFAFGTFQDMFLYVFAVTIPMVVLVRTIDRIRFIFYAWIAVHVGLVLYALTHSGRGTGSFLADENDLALAFNTAIPFAYFLRVSAKEKVAKLALNIALVMLVTGVVLTMSRGGFVGLAVTSLAIIWFSHHKVKNFALVVLAGLIFVLAMPDTYQEEIVSIADSEDRTRNERFFLWGRAWEMYVDNPVFGVGASNYLHRVAEYQVNSESWDGKGRVYWRKAVHSLPFQLIAELGTAGVVLFAWLALRVRRSLAWILSHTRQLKNAHDAQFCEAMARSVVAAMVGFLATSVFISVLYYPQFWYLVTFSVLISSCVNDLLNVRTEVEPESRVL